MRLAAACVLLALVWPSAAAQGAGPFDLLFLGGEVVDGTGAPRARADVGVRGDRIAALGDLRGAEARDTVDISGLVLAPGFIDPYTNYGGFIAGTDGAGRTHENALQQGITTTAISVEGGFVDKREERAAYEREGMAINLAPLFPFSVAWAQVVGDGEPTAAQVGEVARLARQAMEDGAFGMGLGLAYCPSCRAPTQAIVEVAREVAPYRGVVTAHIRNEGDHVMNATQEMVTIAQAADVPAVVHHMKVMGAANCGLAEQTTALLRDAQLRGLDLSANQYPYSAGWTSDLGLLVPDEHEQGTEVDRQLRWRNPATRPQVVADIDALLERAVGTPDHVYFTFQRTTLAQEAQLRGVSPGEAVLQMLENHEVRWYVLHFGCDEDLRTIMTQPWVSVMTDGAPWSPAHEAYNGHPRSYGTYPRVLGEYVRERGWLSLEDAVRKMTGQNAYRLGLASAERGLVREAWFADLVVFDPATVSDQATYEDPNAFSAGMAWVLVNGVPVLRDGHLAPLLDRTQAPPGRWLVHTPEMPSTPQPGYDLRPQAAPPVAAATPLPGLLAGAGLVLAALLRRRGS